MVGYVLAHYGVSNARSHDPFIPSTRVTSSHFRISADSITSIGARREHQFPSLEPVAYGRTTDKQYGYGRITFTRIPPRYPPLRSL